MLSLGAAPKIPPSPGKPSKGGTEVVSSVSTYIQQGDPQMACGYTAWSWVTKDAGPEQPGDGCHSRGLHSEPTPHSRGLLQVSGQNGPNTSASRVRKNKWQQSLPVVRLDAYFHVKPQYLQYFESNHPLVQFKMKEWNES